MSDRMSPGEDRESAVEEKTLSMLEQLGASVRPARHVPNKLALNWALDILASPDPPQELVMEWFSMGDAEAAELAHALKANSSVKVLRLRYNEIRDAGAEALAGALAVHPTLETLAIGNNLIGNKGAQALSAAIASRATLTSLDLRYNQLGPDLPESFCKMSSVTALDLRANRLTSLPPALASLANLKQLVVQRNHDLCPASLRAPNLAVPELRALIRSQAPDDGMVA